MHPRKRAASTGRTRRPAGLLWLMSALPSLVLPAQADEARDSTQVKLDSLMTMQREILEITRSLNKDLLSIDPFPDGARAITLNLPLLLAASSEATIISASYCRFPPHSQSEWVIPVWFRDDHNKYDFSTLMVDLQGRYYMNPRRSGMFWVGGLRLAQAKGRTETEYGDWPDFIETGGGMESCRRLGLYGGVGWRSHSQRFYWSLNIVIGRYLGEEAPNFRSGSSLESDLLIDAEFFKFGVIF